jgi:hypothetical protein
MHVRVLIKTHLGWFPEQNTLLSRRSARSVTPSYDRFPYPCTTYPHQLSSWNIIFRNNIFIFVIYNILKLLYYAICYHCWLFVVHVQSRIPFRQTISSKSYSNNNNNNNKNSITVHAPCSNYLQTVNWFLRIAREWHRLSKYFQKSESRAIRVPTDIAWIRRRVHRRRIKTVQCVRMHGYRYLF